MKVAVIIPALNEEGAIGAVIDEIPRPLVERVIVVDNGSSDRTAEVAREHGAVVVREEHRGYGNACLRGIAALDGAEIVVFLDGDHSDFPEEIVDLVDPIEKGEADMVIGSRPLGNPERGALTPQQVFGNRLACAMIRILFRHKYTDLGPFRAIRAEALHSLGMLDRTYGWTVEMQVKAVRKGLRVREVPVRYRRRIGKSKVSGTVRGTLGAGYKIITTILRYAR
jgi:glycosyltransferase involved in cell wall biosynthesis